MRTGLTVDRNTSVNVYENISKSKRSLFNKPEPFLKWAGGKRQLLDKFEKYFPKKFNNYLEPFLGGGAVFFHLFSTGRLFGKKITLIDSNLDLMNCYRVIKNEIDSLITYLPNGKHRNDENIFYRIREENPNDPVEKAARMIYLNKTCYNGLYRVNRNGRFNVPFGNYKNPLICDTENLIAVSNVLQNVRLIKGDFTECLKYACSGDFLYFDPPYQPISKTASFTGYTSNCFNEKSQERLAEVLKELDRRQCKVMISNSDDSFIKKLYKDFNIEIVKARRAINCKGSKRGEINELVILNY
ncbi:MAG: modification methylase [Elusimicrobia bacterium CG_4_10_14_0_8_um_filter_37_32]|nr:MAG: modification methylase [Elusimicrobia bacterium CG_4_10_14_0_8_um_filter_37_32]